MRPTAAETLQSDAASKDSLGSGHVLGAQAVYRLLRQRNVVPHLSRTAETNCKWPPLLLLAIFGLRRWVKQYRLLLQTHEHVFWGGEENLFGLRLANTCGTFVYRQGWLSVQAKSTAARFA